MGNGVDFKSIALDLRSKLTQCEESRADLLEALEEAMSMLGWRLIKDTFGYEWHEKASAAIARARGES